MIENQEQDNRPVTDEFLRRRSIGVKVHFSPDLYKQIDTIAERRGFPLASMIPLIIGEYVERVNQDLQIQRMFSMELARQRAANFKVSDE